jgi:hypothetical protein
MMMTIDSEKGLGKPTLTLMLLNSATFSSRFGKRANTYMPVEMREYDVEGIYEGMSEMMMRLPST